ncbi:hypothetical protein FAM23282_01447 [Lentilactobacillus parabuchneri]|uniref:hypothetical protein n=1 Tax=Lentilactobacillus parabuchneri TaxID=152331 RepID=UPI000A0F7681|nr:hypothetical protein [Lentilactobacillus parabuchneri]MDB1103459.1 hypothetical protein [Lentilactobacillus parabuchneri]ORN39609.1 hypothetical protein FAM23282_01447 [Lentilactobacillus parabuchneri]
MGLILPDLKGNITEFGGGYLASGANSAVKMGGMYYADGKGNITKMFATASNGGGGDDNLMFADTDFVLFKDFTLKITAPESTFTNSTYTNKNVYQNGITLSKNIADCPNGIQLNFNVIGTYGAQLAGWNGTDWNAPSNLYLRDISNNVISFIQIPKTIADTGNSKSIGFKFFTPFVGSSINVMFFINIANNGLKIFGSYGSNNYYYVPVIHSITSY